MQMLLVRMKLVLVCGNGVFACFLCRTRCRCFALVIAIRAWVVVMMMVMVVMMMVVLIFEQAVVDVIMVEMLIVGLIAACI